MGKAILDLGDAPRLIYNVLRERILSGELAAGEQIKIQDVADETGASAGPVREAIRMLASEGLMELRPRRSPIVAPLELSEILEITNIRQALEPFLLGLAISNHTPETLALCHRLIQQDENSESNSEKVELNRQLHIALLVPANQPRALKVLEDQYASIARFAQMLVMRSIDGLRGHVHGEHLKILNTIEAGKADDVVAMLENHIASASKRIEEQLTKFPQK